MKKILTLLLCVMMVVVYMPTMAFATGGGEAGSDVTDIDTPDDSSTPVPGETEGSGEDTGEDDEPQRNVITLEENTELETLETNTTYDLNGHNLTVTGTTSIQPGEGEVLEICDSSVSEDGRGGTLTFAKKRLTTNADFNPQKGGTVTVSNINIVSPNSVFFPQGNAAAVNVFNCDVKAGCYCVGTNANNIENGGVRITLRDSTLTAGSENSDDKDNCTVMINVPGNLEIDNCVITGDRQTVLVRAGEAMITNSRLINTGGYVSKYSDRSEQYHNGGWDSGNEVPAAAIVVGNHENMAAPYAANANVDLTNCTVESNENTPALYVDANSTYSSNTQIAGEDTEVTGRIIKTEAQSGNISIEAGIFTVNPSDFLSEDYVIKTLSDNRYEVVSVGIEGDWRNDKRLVVGKTYQVEFSGGNDTVTWESDNEEVATVNNSGLVTAVGPGTVTISMKNDNGDILCQAGFDIAARPVHENDVAKVGETGYKILEDAVGAISGVGKITLLENTDLSYSGLIISEGKKITLDLNGNEIKAANTDTGQIRVEGYLTIEDSKKSGKIYSVTDYQYDHSGYDVISVEDNGSLTLNSGEIESVIGENPEEDGYYAVGVYDNGTVTVNGGTIRSGWAAISGNYDQGQNTTISIRGGQLISHSKACIWLPQTGTTTISGGKIEGVNGIDIEDGTLNVTGGEIKATPGNDAILVTEDAGVVTKVSGGTFSSELPAEYLVAGYQQRKNSDNTFTVYKPSPVGGNTPAGPSDNVTNSGTTGTGSATTTADVNTTTSGGTTSAVVNQTTADKIVDNAISNQSTEVVVDVTTGAGTAGNTTVTLPTDTVQKIADKTKAEVTVKTDAAEVTLDQKAVEAVASKAAGSTVEIVVEKTKDETKEMEFELKVVSNGVVIGEFDGGNVKVTVKLNTTLKALKDAVLTCVYIDDKGKYSKVGGKKNADGTFTFVTNHFSSYAIMTEEEADAVIGAQVDELIKGLDDIDLTARSARTSKGNVKITLKVDKKGKALIDELEVAGYTVKYNFYRSTKKRAGYASKKIKEATSYTNTQGKKGTLYYYKARVQVYDADGKLIARTALKDCKYASRLWKK